MNIVQIVSYVIATVATSLLVWQLVLLRKQIRHTLVADTYNKWIQVGLKGVEYPRLQLMELGAGFYNELKDLPEEELQRRCYAIVMFDMFSNIYQQVHKEGNYRGFRDYVKLIASNPLIRKCWQDYHVRDTFAEPFRGFVDEAMMESKATIKSPT